MRDSNCRFERLMAAAGCLLIHCREEPAMVPSGAAAEPVAPFQHGELDVRKPAPWAQGPIPPTPPHFGRPGSGVKRRS